MKIEKINDNQIRCILTKEDLEERQLKISELAYGTDKAKMLFRDMMEQAAFQVGFKTDNIPLMIEAIPMSGGSIVLVVTKVDNPEELDTRFSSFAPSVDKAASNVHAPTAFEQLINAIRSNFTDSMDSQVNTAAESTQTAGDGAAAINDSPQSSNAGQGTSAKESALRQSRSSADQENSERIRMRHFVLTHRLFSFDSMEDACQAASRTQNRYTGESVLLYDEDDRLYYLFLTMKNIEEVSSMQSVLAAISEYGYVEPVSYARQQYMQDHCRMIIAENAVGVLASL